MRTVHLDSIGKTVSQLGFGCGSLGSRVDPASGLRALAEAYKGGVCWFDVAPSYGDGQAERLLGHFLKDRPRDSYAVLDKVGIAPPPKSVAKTALRPAVRQLLQVAPPLRGMVRRFRPRPQPLALTGELIESSVEASLARLGLEFLDVLALHDPRVEDLYRDDVTEALQRVLVRGQARAIGVAGSPEAALAALERLGVRIVQLANNPFQPTMNRLRLSPLTASVDTVTHTVYGHEGFAERMAAVLARDCQVRDHAQALGYSPVPALAARQIMLDYAFASNLQGVVLLSMYKPVHIQAAVARAAGDGVPGAVIDLVGEIVLSHMGSGA